VWDVVVVAVAVAAVAVVVGRGWPLGNWPLAEERLEGGRLLWPEGRWSS